MLKNFFLTKKAVALFVAFCFIMGITQSSIVARADDTDSSDLLVSVESKTEVPDGYMGIYTAADMELIRMDLTGNYILMNDIDLSVYDNWEPIGTYAAPFQGILDGNGYSITNMNIESTGNDDTYTYVGLFGVVQSATIFDLVISNSNIVFNGSYYSIGILVGCVSYSTSSSYEPGSIENCTVTNSILTVNGSHATSGYLKTNIGGLIGEVMGSDDISYCVSNVTINVYEGGATIGGISGSGAYLQYCINYGDIYYTDTDCYVATVGGIVGTGSASYSANYGNISIELSGSVYSGSYIGNKVTEYGCTVGGILGNGSSCENCYNAGSINNTFSVTDTYDSGTVIAEIEVGGIIGIASGSSNTISHCYNIGTLSGEATSSTEGVENNEYIGSIIGIVGYMKSSDSATIEECYYLEANNDVVAYNLGNSSTVTDGSTSLTLQQMTEKGNFQGFDFDDIWTMGGEDYPYPILQALSESDTDYVPKLAAPYISIEKTELTEDDGLVKISWEAVENAFRYYINILGSDGTYIAEDNIVSGTETYLSSDSLAAGVTYDIWVYAVDESGFASADSNHLTVSMASSDENMAFVESMTVNSLKNADETTRMSINNAIYNLLFKAQWRPNKNNVNDIDFGSYSSTSTQKQVNAQWPAKNGGGKKKYITDDGLGGTYYIEGAAGCNAYARFVSMYVYGTNASMNRLNGGQGVDNFISLIHTYADPGEHIRIGETHSVVFLGEDANGVGFYYVDYGDNNGTDPSIEVHYTTYTAFVNKYSSYTFSVWDTNGGSYSAETASDISAVRSKYGATTIVNKMDCPVEAVVTLNSESLSSIGLEDGDTVSTSFGSMQRDGESIIFSLSYNEDYDFEIYGTGEGTMTLTLMYYADDSLIDTRTYIDVPITANTIITTSKFDPCADFVLYIDNGESEEAWGSGINGSCDSADEIYALSDSCIICASEESEEHTHTYNEPEFTWSEDYSTCTATFTCIDGDDTQTVECTVSSETTAASVGVEGKTVYTATCTLQGVEYSDTKEVTIAALDDDTQEEHIHTYNEPEFTWSEDYSTCMATFTCVDGDDTQTVECTVSSETTAASIGVEGKIVYTAICTFQDVKYNDTKEVTISALEDDTSSTNDDSQDQDNDNGTSDSSDSTVDESSSSESYDESVSDTDSSSETDPVTTESSATGDEANLILWVILIAVACAGICTLVYVGRKKNR